MVSLNLETEIVKISKKSLMKHFSLSQLINQDKYWTDAFLAELFTDYYEDLCLRQDVPVGKKHNMQCLFLSGWTLPWGHAQLVLWEGLELCFQGSLCSVECSTLSPAPLTPLWAVTCWRHLQVAASFELRVPSTWKKGFSQCFVALSLCLAPPSPPFETGNLSCLLPTVFSGYPRTGELFLHSCLSAY